MADDKPIDKVISLLNEFEKKTQSLEAAFTGELEKSLNLIEELVDAVGETSHLSGIPDNIAYTDKFYKYCIRDLATLRELIGRQRESIAGDSGGGDGEYSPIMNGLNTSAVAINRVAQVAPNKSSDEGLSSDEIVTEATHQDDKDLQPELAQVSIVSDWAEYGFSPEDASDWAEYGLSPEKAFAESELSKLLEDANWEALSEQQKDEALAKLNRTWLRLNPLMEKTLTSHDSKGEFIDAESQKLDADVTKCEQEFKKFKKALKGLHYGSPEAEELLVEVDKWVERVEKLAHDEHIILTPKEQAEDVPIQAAIKTLKESSTALKEELKKYPKGSEDHNRIQQEIDQATSLFVKFRTYRGRLLLIKLREGGTRKKVVNNLAIAFAGAGIGTVAVAVGATALTGGVGGQMVHVGHVGGKILSSLDEKKKLSQAAKKFLPPKIVQFMAKEFLENRRFFADKTKQLNEDKQITLSELNDLQFRSSWRRAFQ